MVNDLCRTDMTYFSLCYDVTIENCSKTQFVLGLSEAAAALHSKWTGQMRGSRKDFVNNYKII